MWPPPSPAARVDAAPPLEARRGSWRVFAVTFAVVLGAWLIVVVWALRTFHP